MKKNNLHGCRIMTGLLLVLFLHVSGTEQSCAQSATKVDWLQGYVSATGRGYAKKTGGAMGIDNAVEAAKIIAQSELLEAIKGVKIDNQTAVSDLMTERTETSARVQGVLHNAVQVGEPQIKEDGDFVIATVKMRLCLYNNGTGCKSDNPLASVLPKSSRSNNTSCNFFPNIASTQEILSKVTYDTNQPLSMFIINIKGMPFNAESRDFMIGFKGDGGQICSVYSPEKVDPMVRRDRGTAEIFFHVSDAKQKHGANVVVIAAKSIDQKNYIMIGEKDAYLLNLLNERENKSLFKEGRIGIAAQN